MRSSTLALAEQLAYQATTTANHEAHTNAHTLDWDELHDPRWEKQLHTITLQPQTRLNAAHIITYRTHLDTRQALTKLSTHDVITYPNPTRSFTITNAIRDELLHRHATQHGRGATNHLTTTNPPHTWALLATAETH